MKGTLEITPHEPGGHDRIPGSNEGDEPVNVPWDSSEALNQGRRGATPPHTYGALKNFVEPRAQGQRPRLDATTTHILLV